MEELKEMLLENFLVEELKEMLLANMNKLVELVHSINSYNGGLEDLALYDVDVFDELMGEYVRREGAWKFACMVAFGAFEPVCSCDYFGFDGYGHLVSYSRYEYEELLEEAIDDIIETMENLPLQYLPEWLKEYEAERSVCFE